MLPRPQDSHRSGFAVLLGHWLSVNQISIPQFAARIGLSRMQAWRLVKGKARPGEKTANKIYRITEGQVGPADLYPSEIPADVEAAGQSGPVASSPGLSSLLSAPAGMGKHAPAGDFAAGVGHGD